MRATAGVDGGSEAVELLLRAVDALIDKGMLREPLLPFLWRGTALRVEDYPYAARMLCEVGVLFELAAGKTKAIVDGKQISFHGAGSDPSAPKVRQWAMPMRLPSTRPENVGNKLWKAETLQTGQTQLSMRFDFHGINLPPGVIERCVAGGAAAGQLLQCWYDGVLIADGSGTKALLQLVTADARGGKCVWLEASVRGSGEIDVLWPLLWPLVDAVRSVLAEYRGVFYAEEIACPRCPTEGRWSDASMWSIAHDLERGRKTHDYCQQCDARVELLPPPPAACSIAPAAAPAASPAAAPAAAPTTEAGAAVTSPLPPAPNLTATRSARSVTGSRGTVPTTSGSSKWAEPPRVKRKYHAFLTHDWGKDAEGRDNHTRVIRTCQVRATPLMSTHGLPRQ